MAMGWYYDENEGKYLFGESPDAVQSLTAKPDAMLSQGMEQAPKTLDFSKQAGPEADMGRAQLAAMNQKRLDQLNKQTAETQTPETPENTSGISKDQMAKGAQVAGKGIEQAAAGGNLKETGIDTAGDALILYGDPSMKALGVGLKTGNAIMKGKQQREQNRYLAEVEKYKQRQEAIFKLANIGQSLRA